MAFENASEEDKIKIEQIYHEYRGLMHYIAREILVDSSLADDAVSESFIKLMNNIGKIGEFSYPRTHSLIVTIVRNTSINIYKKAMRDKGDTDIELEDIVDLSPLVDEEVVSMEGYNDIVDLVDTLPEVLKEVLELSIYNDLSNKEIAEITGIKYETVKKRAYRARALMKNKLVKCVERR